METQGNNGLQPTYSTFLVGSLLTNWLVNGSPQVQ